MLLNSIMSMMCFSHFCIENPKAALMWMSNHKSKLSFTGFDFRLYILSYVNNGDGTVILRLLHNTYLNTEHLKTVLVSQTLISVHAIPQLSQVKRNRSNLKVPYIVHALNPFHIVIFSLSNPNMPQLISVSSAPVMPDRRSDLLGCYPPLPPGSLQYNTRSRHLGMPFYSGSSEQLWKIEQ
ncbi:hypothetical protein J4Q44_G00271460 [Coregonus suidteri]|uniref:Uncharacterized protein n=1 Tax=Coregonus suidteri TaxID=861788 RepID=A0AAN8LKR3_9TELE